MFNRIATTLVAAVAAVAAFTYIRPRVCPSTRSQPEAPASEPEPLMTHGEMPRLIPDQGDRSVSAKFHIVDSPFMYTQSSNWIWPRFNALEKQRAAQKHDRFGVAANIANKYEFTLAQFERTYRRLPEESRAAVRAVLETLYGRRVLSPADLRDAIRMVRVDLGEATNEKIES